MNSSSQEKDSYFDRHFEKLGALPERFFIIRVSVESFLLSIGGALISRAILGHDLQSEGGLSMATPLLHIVDFVLLIPLLETFLLQALPIGLARVLRWPIRNQLLLSITFFVLCHVIASGWSGVLTGLIGGFYLAFTYTTWRRKSLAAAWRITFVVHALHNALLLLIALILSTTN